MPRRRKKQRTHVTGVGASWKQYYNRQLWLAQNHPTLAAFSAVPMKSKLRSFRFKANEKAEEHCLEKFSSFLEVMEQDQYLNTERTIFDSGTMFFWWVRRRQFFCFKDAYLSMKLYFQCWTWRLSRSRLRSLRCFLANLWPGVICTRQLARDWSLNEPIKVLNGINQMKQILLNSIREEEILMRFHVRMISDECFEK